MSSFKMSIIYEALQKAERKTPHIKPAIKTTPRQSPEKDKLKPVIVILIVIVVTSGAAFSLARKNASKTQTYKNTPPGTATTLAHDKPQTNSIIKKGLSLPRISFTQPETEYPAYSYNSKTTDGVEFTLSGIISAKSKYMAIVNGKRVTKGDTIEKATVSDINDNSVELSLGDKKITLSLY